MQNDLEQENSALFAKVTGLIESGLSVETACKQANWPKSVYYNYRIKQIKKGAYTPKNLRKRSRAKPTSIQIPMAAVEAQVMPARRMIALVGDSHEVIAALRGIL